MAWTPCSAGLAAKLKRRRVVAIVVSAFSLFVCLGLDLATPWLLATDSNSIIELASELPEACEETVEELQVCLLLAHRRRLASFEYRRHRDCFWNHIGVPARGVVALQRHGVACTSTDRAWRKRGYPGNAAYK